MATAPKIVRKYRLVSSQHIVRNPAFDPTKPAGEDNKKSITYVAGDVVEGVDLDKQHVNKFVTLDPYAVVAPAVPVREAKKTEKSDLDKTHGDLDKMTVEDLREVAEIEEIDLGGATLKADILRKLRGK